MLLNMTCTFAQKFMFKEYFMIIIKVILLIDILNKPRLILVNSFTTSIQRIFYYYLILD